MLVNLYNINYHDKESKNRSRNPVSHAGFPRGFIRTRP